MRACLPEGGAGATHAGSGGASPNDKGVDYTVKGCYFLTWEQFNTWQHSGN